MDKDELREAIDTLRTRTADYRDSDIVCVDTAFTRALLDALDTAEQREAQLKRVVWEMSGKVECECCPVKCDEHKWDEDCQPAIYYHYTGEDGPPEGAGDTTNT